MSAGDPSDELEPSGAFLSQLRRWLQARPELEALRLQARPELEVRPDRVRTLIVAYAVAGALLLAVGAISAAGGGPLGG